MLFNRLSLGVFDEVHRWVRRCPDARRYKVLRLSRGACDKLFGAVLIGNLSCTDLRAAISPRVYLSAASQAKGAVACATLKLLKSSCLACRGQSVQDLTRGDY
eukprot:6239321-Amphidinium_carterae.2